MLVEDGTPFQLLLHCAKQLPSRGHWSLLYSSSLYLYFIQMTSRQLSDFFERSFHWAPCLPCRTASLPCQSWRRTSLTTAPTEVKSQSLQTWRTQSDSWVKEWHFMMYRWLSSTTRTYLVEGGGLTPRVSSWHSDIIKVSSVFFTLIYVNIFNKKTRAAPSKESSHSLEQCNQNWKQNAIILRGGK